MKLIRYGALNNEKPGVMVDNEYYDTSEFINEYDEAFFANGGLEKLTTILQKGSVPLLKVDHNTRLGCPVCKPSKIICVGLNYADHAHETNAEIPAEPILFMKSTTSVSGPNDPIIIPRGSVKTDWEVELAVVIGKKASYVEESEAMDYVAGYCLHNDVSERAFQLEMGGTWDKGKGCDSFAPLGPFLVTKDEIRDVNALDIWLTVNGTRMQFSNTSNLIFKIPFLVSYISRFMTLLPGDIISTGTPNGVGLGMKPETYLKEGDVVQLGIEGLGMAKQRVIPWTKQ